jgi:hypothetical protein
LIAWTKSLLAASPFRRGERKTSMTYPKLVDGPEQVAPGPADLQIHLIDVPAIPDQVLASSCGLGELGREALDPAVDRDVVDLDPVLGQELLDVPVGEAEPQYQRTARVMTSGGKRYPAKAELGARWG